MPRSYMIFRKPVSVQFSLVIVICFMWACNDRKQEEIEGAGNWYEYNGGPDRNHYSSLRQINSGNVARLRKVWEYTSGGADTARNVTQMQCNPIIIDGILYGVSAGSQAFALDAATGEEIWKTNFTDETNRMTSRGVTYYEDANKKRIFFGFGYLLYALDAGSGKPDSLFGTNGKIDLREGLAQPGADDYVAYNTPGVIFKNLLITGSRLSESASALPGDIRAFNVHTGKLAWTFHTIPEPGELGSDTWPPNARQNTGGANSWMGMAIDRENEIVYAPTGSAAFDFYGGDRHGANLFANCLIALDANTGKRKWHYQVVRHDIWDRDLPAPPNLVTLDVNGKKVPAVAQITKQGHIFLFNRLTGEPLFPIQEMVVEGSEIPGEKPYPTQPVPVKPLPFTRQSFTERDVNPSAMHRDEIIATLRASKTGSPYIPLSRNRTIIFPGTDGGAQWGGAAVDEDGVMYIPAKEIPVFTSLTDAPTLQPQTSPSKLYQVHCGACHGGDLRGDHSGTYPSLVDIDKKMAPGQLHELLIKGRGMMSGFGHLSKNERDAIVDFVLHPKDTGATVTASVPKRKSPYVHTGYNRWYDSSGYPVNTPPWGTLTAVDLNTGERKWQVPLGEFPALRAKGVPPTGTDNYGGPVITASGLLFIAATPDKKFRAIDKKTGKMLWETELPAAGFASPSTYSVQGKQYVVIACGGGKLKAKSGDKYVAFALEEP